MEELINLTKEDGIELSEAEVGATFDLLQDDVEISDEDQVMFRGVIDLSLLLSCP